MRTLILSLCLMFTHQAWAQYTFNFQQEYFFGNLPSAKTEAMGRADAAIGGSVNSVFFNPAGLGGIEEQEATFSTSAPFYALTESDYYFFGYGRRILPKLTVAFTANQLAVGPTFFETRIDNVNFPLDSPKSTNIGLSAAYEVIDGLHVGLSTNMYAMKFFENVNSSKKLHLDIGALYRHEISSGENKSQHLQVGASVNNFTSSNITFDSPISTTATQTLPVVGRFGVAYLIKTPLSLPKAGTGSFDLTFTAEYQNVLNSGFRTAILFGAEAKIWDVFAFRMGYLNQSLDDMGFTAINRTKLEDFTYGFGFIIPLNTLTQNKFPVRIHLDYVSLKQPTFTIRGRRAPNMRTFGIRVVWPLPSN